MSLDPHLARDLVGYALIALALCFFLFLWAEHQIHNGARRLTGHPPKSALDHVRTHAAHHVSMVALVALGLSLVVGAGTAAYVLTHHGGATFHQERHIAPPVHHVGGAAPGSAGASLVSYVRARDTLDQGQTNSCCGVTIARLDTLGREIRDGEYPAPDAPISGYRPWWYATAGHNVGSDPADDLAALNTHGLEAVAYWGSSGYPDASDTFHTLSLPGAGFTWDFYQASGGGRAGLDDIEYRLARNRPVGVIWAVHQQGEEAQGSYTWDGGSFVFWHCLVAIAWSPHAPGGIGEGIELWNSWGASYGQGGFIWLPAAVVESHIAGAFTETPGLLYGPWLPPRPATPSATARPRPRPTIHSTARPTPHSSPRPSVCLSSGLRIAKDANMHARPVLGSAAILGLPRGSIVLSVCPRGESTHWRLVSAHGKRGWLLKGVVSWFG